MNFYREFDRNEDMTFEKDEMTQCFEAFANEDMIGKEFMKLVLEKAGVDNIATGLMALFKEGQYANSVFLLLSMKCSLSNWRAKRIREV